MDQYSVAFQEDFETRGLIIEHSDQGSAVKMEDTTLIDFASLCVICATVLGAVYLWKRRT